jgi:hypothetical protein
MTGFPPTSAAVQGLRHARRQADSVIYTALAGVRLTRDQPRTVAAWMLLWFLYISASAFIVVYTRPLAGGRGDYSTIAAKLGPWAIISIAAFLVIWTLTTLASFRAILQPANRGFAYLRVGYDEVRLALLSAGAGVLIVGLEAVLAYLLFTLVLPFLEVLPGWATFFTFAGATATVCLNVWIGVRLSLIAVETFAEGRFHLTAYWPLTHGRFWYLLGVYLVCFLIACALFSLLPVSAFVTGALLSAIGAPHGPDLARRVAILALAGANTVLVSAVSVMSLTIFCAAQAHAYRVITGVQRRRMQGF